MNNQPESGLPKLSQPALRALAGAGITRLAQLTGYGESEIRQLHGIGPRALKTLREALAVKGLSFQEKK
ncbi:MAG: DNA-binding protein [Anaerolineae bacterium]|nr:DNA-binding protein [Anaerolineae bacterium]